MKIGIITFWESTDNYGQVLQAYALQTVLKRLGHDPFQIRYPLSLSHPKWNTPLWKRIIKIILVYPYLKNIKTYCKKRKDASFACQIQKKNMQRQFPEFRKKYIKCSDFVYSSYEELLSNPPQADAYITGSDQVWTMSLGVTANRAYFLDFGAPKIRRISYAASFSMSVYPEKYRTLLRELLRKIDCLSVREFEGVEICRNEGVFARLVLDPTLLLPKSVYMALSDNSQKNEKFVYVYSINIRRPEEMYWDEVKSYARKHNVKLISTTSSGYFPGREVLDNTTYTYDTIPSWIKHISESELVVTTSFHGVVFCLIMHTNFVFIPLQTSNYAGNNRVTSLLSLFGVQGKICSKSSDFESCVEMSIDWKSVDFEINKHKESSIEFLRKSLV